MSISFRHIRTEHLGASRSRWLSNSFHMSISQNANASSSTAPFRDFSRRLVPQEPIKPVRKRRKDIVGPSVIEDSKLRQHLDYIEATKENLVLEDIERYKPEKRVDSKLPTYDQKYEEIRNALIQSFTKPQLRKFLRLYGLPAPPVSKGKDIFAEVIMEKWGWQPLARVREERGDWTRTSDLVYPLSPGSAFLLVGKDGADLLNLTQQYNVHLSFNSEPLMLKVKGLRGDVKRMDKHMKYFDGDIALEKRRLPLCLKISSKMAQSISRLSGAYVETDDDTKVSITYRKSRPESVEHVMRLAVQAASEGLDRNSGLVEWLSGEAGSSFSFYPFFPSQMASRRLQDSNSFRVRRVGQWLRAGARYSMDGEDLHELTLSRQSEVNIESSLLDEIAVSPLSNSRRVVTASTGHFLFLTSPGQATFTPPIIGDVEGSVALQWVKDHSTRTIFNPSVPKACMLSWPHLQKQFTRIVYKAHTGNNEKRKVLTFEIIDSPSAPMANSSSNAPEPSTEDVVCHRSVETHMDILLPSRTTDLRISAANVENIPLSSIPLELRSLITMTNHTSETWANVPLTLNLDGLDYMLSSTSKIRKGHHKMSDMLLGKPIQYDFVVETTLDSEEGQYATVCKVICNNPDARWDKFLWHCDHLTMVDDKPTSDHPLAMIKPWFNSNQSDNTLDQESLKVE